MNINSLTMLCVAIAFPLATSAEQPDFAASTSNGIVKVFILAGQSNMEGRGF